MSSPPPDQWRPPPPPTGPAQGPPFGSPPWGPQQPPGPPNSGGAVKWLLGGMVLIVVVAVSVGATLLFTRDNTGEGPSTGTSAAPTSGGASDFASADDKGAVKVITEDPTCAPWTPINDTLADQTRGWDKRDPSISASVWTPEVRAQFSAVAQAMRDAADQTVPLVKLTTHRVMRELYEQFIANARAYADSIPIYTPRDDHFAGVTVSAAGALLNICNSIEFGSAGARGPLVKEPDPPSTTAPVANPVHPKPLLDTPDPVCHDWATLGVRFNADIAEWTRTDPNLAVGDWSPQQKTLSATITSVLSGSADDIEALGRRSTNSTVQDFAALYAVYLRAYVGALPTYIPPDVTLYTTAMRTYAVVKEACLVAGA